MEENRLTLRQLRMLARTLRATTINSIELQSAGWSLRMTHTPRPPQPAPAIPVASPAVTTPLCASAPGQVLLRHPLLEHDFATAGAHVARHQLLALLQVGPLYLPLRSPAAGTVISFAISHAQAVEYGSEILRIREDVPPPAAL